MCKKHLTNGKTCVILNMWLAKMRLKKRRVRLLIHKLQFIGVNFYFFTIIISFLRNEN